VQRNPLAVLYRVVLLAALILLIGVLGYRATTGLAWLDALYMTVITLSTVGYREVGPLDDAGKVFTICLILGGAGVVAFAVKTSVEVVLDESTHQYFRQRTTLKKLAKMKNHYIVCGLGRVGRAVCEELRFEKQDFVLIEVDPLVFQEANERGWTVLQGDATDEHTLAQAGIEHAKGLMSCVKSDSDNLMVIMTARGMRDGLKISARVSDERNLKKFRRAGADYIYSPFSLVGRRIARSLTRPRVMELLDLALEEAHYDLNFAEYPIPPSSDLVGKTLVESEFRSRYGLVILSLIREDRTILHNPPANTVFQAADILVVLGTPSQVELLTGVSPLPRAAAVTEVLERVEAD
jgi:voltage-gated potassium channel